MFDIGWPEIFLIVVVAVLAIGPKELPAVMVMLGRIARRLHYVRYAFSQQFDEFMRDADMEDLRKQVNFEEKSFDEKKADEEEAGHE